MKDIIKDDMQHIIDSCQLGYSSLSSLKDLFTQMCSYSMENGIINMDYSKYLKINAEKDIENGEPFTEHEIELLWQNKDNKYVQIILILIYTGMRGGELKATTIDYENKVFVGGLKTTAGRDRIIPFPDIIYDYILSFDQEKFSPNNFRDKIFYKLILSIGMDPLTNGKKHTPHDCRHTFSWLADKYKMDEVSKHLLMGHSLGKDVERSTYGHRTFEELKPEINKIEAPDLSLTCC
jgi:integrase